ncbi:MAG: sugar ABC transporter permease [Alphaproteobacteria bacterium]|nr:sugar ABC transporter permease [Alphaproteobacteria bacterium]
MTKAFAPALGAAGRARYRRTERGIQLWLVGPAIFVMLLIGLFPLVYSLVVSVQYITMMDHDTSWHGFIWYEQLFADKRFWESMWHTVIITVIALPIELIVGLMLARLFLNELPGRPVFIALLLLPSVLCPVVVGAIWRLMFDTRFGPISHILSWLLDKQIKTTWLVEPAWVYPVILITEIWQWFPFMFLILLAALSNVDRSLTEAAEIDGASFWAVFFRISLPAVWPVMFIAIMIRLLDLVRIFDIIYVLTRGGPGTMTETTPMYMYIAGFHQFDTSYTGAMVFVIIVLLSIIVITLLRRVEYVR